MCGYFCIGFIDYTFAGKTLIDYATVMDKIYETNSSFHVKQSNT